MLSFAPYHRADTLIFTEAFVNSNNNDLQVNNESLMNAKRVDKSSDERVVLESTI